MSFPSKVTAWDFYPSNLIKGQKVIFHMTFGDKRDPLNVISPHVGSICRSASAWGPGNKEMKTYKFNAETTRGIFFWKKREFSKVNVCCMKTCALKNNWVFPNFFPLANSVLKLHILNQWEPRESSLPPLLYNRLSESCLNHMGGHTIGIDDRDPVSRGGWACLCDRDDHLKMTVAWKPAMLATWTNADFQRFSDKTVLLQLLFLNCGQLCPVPMPAENPFFLCFLHVLGDLSATLVSLQKKYISWHARPYGNSGTVSVLNILNASWYNTMRY